MSATDELREMLDERGVEWAVPDESWNQDSITYWKVGSIKWVAFESENGTLWLNCNSVTDLTPEQAVDATVMQPVDSLHPSDAVVCKKCGMAYRVVKLDVDDGYLISEDVFECVPNYCPRCGAGVVE